METELAGVLDLLGIIRDHIQLMEHIADPKTVVEVVPHSKSGKRYARKRTTIDGKRSFEGCGLEGSEQHLDAISSVQRRQLLDKAQDLIEQVETWKQSEDWQRLKRQLRAATKDVDTVEETKVTPNSPSTATSATNLISFGFKGGKGASISNRVSMPSPGNPPLPLCCGSHQRSVEPSPTSSNTELDWQLLDFAPELSQVREEAEDDTPQHQNASLLTLVTGLTYLNLDCAFSGGYAKSPRTGNFK